MESLFVRYKNALVLMLVLLAQVVLLAMQVRRPAPDMPDGHNVRLWRYMVTSVVTPPARLAHGIGKSVRGVWDNYLDLRRVRERNLSLQEENDRLRLEQVSLAQDALEGQRLREMLDFRGRYIDKTIAAQVIGTSGTDQAKVILIDRGSAEGLQVQMPVITPDGIVGKIKNVFPHSAQVLLISDQTSGTGVILETTHVRGVMKGNASGQPQMINISPDDRIKPGEPLMTSGGDQVYPPGMPVGVVDHVVADPDTSYVNVVIKPNANLAALEEVLVVTEFSDKMPFAQAKDILQSEVVALAEKQRAADVLSEKLPSLRDETAPEGAPGLHEESATGGDGDPARPVRPPQPLHPDRYTPGAAPDADTLTPGAAPPMTHRVPSTEASAAGTTSTPKSNSGTATAASPGSEAALVSRFPAKPSLIVAKPAGASPPTSTASGGVLPGSVAGSSAGQSRAATVGPAGQIQAGQTPAGRSLTGQTPTGSVSAGRPVGMQATAGQTAGTQRSTGGQTAGNQTPGLQRPGSQSLTGQSRAGQATSGQSPSGSGENAAPVRKAPSTVDSDSGGILTPAGMGSLGAAPRPRAANPAGGTGAIGAGTQAAPAGKPAASKLPKAPAGSQSGPSQSAPPPQRPAATPPGGV